MILSVTIQNRPRAEWDSSWRSSANDKAQDILTSNGQTSDAQKKSQAKYNAKKKQIRIPGPLGQLISYHDKCQHGTPAGYDAYYCRCGACSLAKSIQQALARDPEATEVNGEPIEQLRKRVTYLKGLTTKFLNENQTETELPPDSAEIIPEVIDGGTPPTLDKVMEEAEKKPKKTQQEFRQDRRAERIWIVDPTNIKGGYWFHPGDKVKHGTIGARTYYGCCCDKCRDAENDRKRNGYIAAKNKQIASL